MSHTKQKIKKNELLVLEKLDIDFHKLEVEKQFITYCGKLDDVIKILTNDNINYSSASQYTFLTYYLKIIELFLNVTPLLDFKLDYLKTIMYKFTLIFHKFIRPILREIDLLYYGKSEEYKRENVQRYLTEDMKEQ